MNQHTTQSRPAWLAGALTVVAIVAPKCPACLAGYLAVVGFGTGVAVVAPWIRPVALVAAALAVALARRRRSRIRARPTCCGGP